MHKHGLFPQSRSPFKIQEIQEFVNEVCEVFASVLSLAIKSPLLMFLMLCSLLRMISAAQVFLRSKNSTDIIALDSDMNANDFLRAIDMLMYGCDSQPENQTGVMQLWRSKACTYDFEGNIYRLGYNITNFLLECASKKLDSACEDDSWNKLRLLIIVVIAVVVGGGTAGGLVAYSCWQASKQKQKDEIKKMELGKVPVNQTESEVKSLRPCIII